LKRPCQKSLPSSLFQREESFGGFDGEFLPLFPPLEKGMKGDLTAFQKAKLLSYLKFQIKKMNHHFFSFAQSKALRRVGFETIRNVPVLGGLLQIT
jgi:hypothetical protein